MILIIIYYNADYAFSRYKIMPCIAGILYNFLKSPNMMMVAKEVGLSALIEKTIERNINTYPSAVQQLVDVRNILLQNKHPSFDLSSDDEEADIDSNDEEQSSASEDNVNINKFLVNQTKS